MTPAHVRRLALALPDVTEEPHFAAASFRVKGRIFATLQPDDLHLHVFVDEDVREPALALHADFLEKLYWGGKVRGLRITLSLAREEVVAALLNRACSAKVRTGKRR